MNYSSYEFKSKNYIYFLALNANLGSVVTGMFFVALNACMWELVDLIGNELSETRDRAMLASAIPFGAIFGALISSCIAAKNGRRSTLIFSDLIAIVGCLISISDQFILMIIGRLICGFVAGMNWTVIPLYVREISPPSLSGRLGAFFRIMFCFGMFLTFVLSLNLDIPPCAKDGWWRVILLFPIGFCILRIFIFLVFVRLDTPKYYISKGLEANATRALSQIYVDEQVDSIYIRESRFEDMSHLNEVLGGKYQKQIKVLFLLIFVNEFMGTSALNFYSSDIFLEKGASDSVRYVSEVRRLNLILSSAIFVATLFGIILIDKFGRRPIIIYGTLFTTLLGILVVFSSFLKFVIGEATLIVLFTVVQTLSINLVLPIYVAELLPAYGIGLQVLFQMICILIVTSTFPFLVELDHGFMIFSAVGLLSLIPMFKLVKETKEKSLNEIYRLFHAEQDKGLLDEEVVGQEFSAYRTF